MALSGIKPSRVFAVAVVLVAGLWIGSGIFNGEPDAAPKPETATPAVPRQKVGIEVIEAVNHSRPIILSCVTEADQQAMAVARATGVITALNVGPGAQVKAGDVIARISDEGRAAAVEEARALLTQRKVTLEANRELVARGRAPKNELPAQEANLAAAEAALAAAEAEAERISVLAPIDGIIDAVPVQLGQAVQVGTEIAAIVDPDPMLAVGAVPEKHRSRLQPGQSVRVRLIDGAIVTGEVAFVSQAADSATRTYRVEVKLENARGRIADGVTCEMTISLDPVVATALPRSALVFSDDGRLGIRAVDSGGRVAFHAVQIIEDNRQRVWVSGLESALRVITLGQDFVKEGDLVDAVSAGELEAPSEPRA